MPKQETQTPKQKLLSAFKDIRMEHSTHTYFVEELKYPSSTTSIIKKFVPTFDEQRMSALVAKKEGVTQEEILKKWSDIREEACSRGSLIHKCLELIPRQEYNKALKVLKKELTKPDFKRLFNEKELKQLKAGIDWYSKLPKHYEILVLELMMFYPEFRHCGTADIILLNKKTGKLVIADWKTNKDLFKLDYYATRPDQYLLAPFDNLIECPYSHYVLQFSHYQMMIERMTDLEVEERWCIWLSDEKIVTGYVAKGEGWVQYNTPDVSAMLYANYKNQAKQVLRPKSLSDIVNKC